MQVRIGSVVYPHSVIVEALEYEAADYSAEETAELMDLTPEEVAAIWKEYDK